MSYTIILTGAGISADSGLKTFRDNDGLWENHRVEDVATTEAFERNPELVQRFYNERRTQLLSNDVMPNPAHYALADFEKKSKNRFLLITQNVDNLHERAGSSNIHHLHGELTKIRCTQCQTIYEIKQAINSRSVCIHCKQIGCLRPHIVWFGEIPLEIERIQIELAQATTFLSIGTSAQVYPAALFVQMVPEYCHKIELNLESTTKSTLFDQTVYGRASEIVPSFMKKLLEEE